MTTMDYAKARELMVEQQVRPWDVLDPRVLDTIARLPREAFVADALRALAYADTALPLGHGEAMMKPEEVAAKRQEEKKEIETKRKAPTLRRKGEVVKEQK